MNRDRGLINDYINDVGLVIDIISQKDITIADRGRTRDIHTLIDY